MMQYWYAALVQPVGRAEWGVHQDLRSQGMDTVHLWRLERRVVTRGRRKRFVGVQAPLFPGYMIVGLERPELLAEVHATRNVVGTVDVDYEPRRLHPAAVAALRARGDANGKCDMRGLLGLRSVAVGDTGRLRTGPFEGSSAKIMRVDGTKLQASIALFSGEIPVWLDEDMMDFDDPHIARAS